MARSSLTLDEAIGHHGKIIKYYRRVVISPPKGWTQEQLAEAANVSTRWVQEMEGMPFIQSVSRRKALALILGIPAALLNVEEAEKPIRRGSARLQTWMMESLEDGTRSRWQLYYTSSNSITEEGLLGHIEILEQLADDGAGDQRRIYRVLTQSYQLAGSLARDNFEYSKAKKYFREAQRLAEEAQSPDLAATAVARHGLVLLRQERVEEALQMYQRAANLAQRAEPHVGAYVQSGLAEALARNSPVNISYRALSYSALDQAQQLLDRARVIPIEEDFAHLRLTAQSFEDTRGECYVLLGEPRKGLDYLRVALQQLDPTMSRRRCRLLMQQAEAHLAAGHPDQCVRYALKGLQLARAIGSTGNTNWASEIHAKLLLSRWKGEPVVGELAVAIIN